MIDIDTHSRTWQTVIDHIDKKQNMVRDQIMDAKCQHDIAQYMRGYYAALQELKELSTRREVSNDNGFYG